MVPFSASSPTPDARWRIRCREVGAAGRRTRGALQINSGIFFGRFRARQFGVGAGFGVSGRTGAMRGGSVWPGSGSSGAAGVVSMADGWHWPEDMA